VYPGVPSPGDVVGAKYRIERVLGAGGMGVVLSAVHLSLQERVAIKVLAPELAASGDAVARFVREARAACRIKSEHVARVSDVGTLENGVPYLVMEYLEGRDLSQLLTERKRLPVTDAVDFILQACEALAEAHLIGIVHRDLKPANLFLTTRLDGSPCIKVLDFGVSKVTHSPGSAGSVGQTQAAAVMGSPLYMSPEQLRAARSVDLRSDIWALGVIAYELLAGKPPFAGETLPEVSVKIAVDRPEPIRAARREVPAGAEAAILKCLEKDREKRFRDVGELASALAPFGPEGAAGSAARIRRVLASSRRSPSEPPPESRTSTVTGVWSPLASTRRWGKSGVWVLAGALTLAIGIAKLRQRGGDAAPVPAAPSVANAELAQAPPHEVSAQVPVVEPLSAEALEPSITPEELPSSSPSAELPPAVAVPAERQRTPPVPSTPSMPATPPPVAAAPAAPMVELLADPPANVLVDGRPLGSTPIKMSLPPGKHRARFYRDNASVTRDFTVLPDQSSVVSVSAKDFNLPNPYRWGSGLESPAAPSPSSATGPPPFDRQEAKTTIEAVAARLGACAGLGDYGTGVVRVSFAPSGRVQDVVLSGDLSDTSGGDCVERLFRHATVRPFSGPSVTLSKRIELGAPSN